MVSLYLINLPSTIRCPLQHCAGASFVERIVESLAPNGNTIVVDMLGYDAWPAAYCLQKVAQGLGKFQKVLHVFTI